MDQLFLAVLRTVMGCRKGRLFARYGPALAEIFEFTKFPSSYRLKLLVTITLSPPDAGTALLKNKFPARPCGLQKKSHTAFDKMPVNIGRKIVRRFGSPFLKLEYNAFEAPLLREGVC